jgi:hypothetical protein
MECTMKILLPSVLLISVAFVPQASANWFSNPDWGINMNIGSAPSPTPQDIRDMRQPMLVRDADGNVVAIVDPVTGKMLAVAEPTSAAKSGSVAAAKTPVALKGR